jgi:hypothetical protein
VEDSRYGMLRRATEVPRGSLDWTISPLGEDASESITFNHIMSSIPSTRVPPYLACFVQCVNVQVPGLCTKSSQRYRCFAYVTTSCKFRNTTTRQKPRIGWFRSHIRLSMSVLESYCGRSLPEGSVNDTINVFQLSIQLWNAVNR